MSWADGDGYGEPRGPADEQRAPLYRVMIGCGIAGVLIAIGAAVVDFGTGRGSDNPVHEVPRLVPGHSVVLDSPR